MGIFRMLKAAQQSAEISKSRIRKERRVGGKSCCLMLQVHYSDAGRSRGLETTSAEQEFRHVDSCFICQLDKEKLFTALYRFSFSDSCIILKVKRVFQQGEEEGTSRMWANISVELGISVLVDTVLCPSAL